MAQGPPGPKYFSLDEVQRLMNSIQQPAVAMPPPPPPPQQHILPNMQELLLAQITELYEKTARAAAATTSQPQVQPQQHEISLPATTQQQQQHHQQPRRFSTASQDELSYVRELEQKNASLLESTRILQVQQLQQQPQHHSPTKPEMDMDTDSTNSETGFNSTIFHHSEYPTLLPRQQQQQQQRTNITYSQATRLPPSPQQQQQPPQKRPREGATDEYRRQSEIQNYVSETYTPNGELFLTENIIIFKGKNKQEIIYYPRPHQVDSLFRNKNRTIHPSNPTLLMDCIPYSNPPPHSLSAHPVLKNNPLMMQKQRQTPCYEHALNGTTCDCHPLSYGYQIQKIVPEICFKKDFANPKDYAIFTENSELLFNENSSHCYFYSHPQNSHLLQLPKPFRIGSDWPNKSYSPALSNTTDTQKIKLFFTLAKPEISQSNIKPYLSPPDRWDNNSHPLFAEPLDCDELSLYSRQAYGSETLSRTLTMNHPCKAKQIPVYSATSTQLSTPLLTMHTKYTLDDFIATALAPFYNEGHGTILCSICIASPSNPEAPCFLTRTQYKAHFRKHHFNNIGFISLGFATRYNTRMYEAFSIYQKINNITDSTVDHPEKHPMHREALKAFATTTDDALRAYFNQPDEAQQMQTAEEHLKSLEIAPPLSKREAKARNSQQQQQNIPGLPPQTPPAKTPTK